MKTATITTLLGLAIWLAPTVSAQEAQRTQDAQEETSPAATAADAGNADPCSRWGFKNLHLGMTVAQVKQQYDGAAPDDRRQDPQSLGGKAYRWQHRDGAQRIDFRVLADGEGDDAKVVEIRAAIRGGGISPEQWHAALLQKWGGIAELRDDEPSAGQTTIDGRSVDDTCDARVSFLGTGSSDEMRLEITLVSIAATQAWQMRQAEEANRNKARDLLE